MADWMARADWTLRTAELGELQERARGVGERFVVMPLRTPGIEDPALSDRLHDLWRELPWHHHIFEPIATGANGDLLVRYAAIDWTAGAMTVDVDAVPLATLGIDLARLFEFLRVCVHDEDLGWFACPFVKLDLHGAPRVGFLNPAGSVQLMNRVAPEVVAQWPRADERAMVFATGQQLLGLIKTTSRTLKTPFGVVLKRCLEPDPRRRFQTLRELRVALAIVGGNRTPIYHGREWKHVELAIGYALLGQPQRAMDQFQIALSMAPGMPLALAGRAEMILRGAKVPDPPTAKFTGQAPITKGFIAHADPRRLPAPWRAWNDVRSVARELVGAGRFADALALYLSTIITPENQNDIRLAIARCHFEAREYGTAVDYAQRVLAFDQQNLEAHELRAEGRYKRREHEDALVACAEWIDAAPTAGQPHYLRAKILLALGRFSEARDECDRATELSPSHLPAMLLRRQLLRSIRRVRAAAGKPLPAPIDLPEHLRDLRALLVAGQTAEAIALLETPEHAADPQAQLLRADLLLFTDQLDAALAAFEKVGGLAGGLGQATVLVRMSRAEDALALCDALVREQPAAAEPHEGRAAALQALGRTAEADEAYKHALAANAQRSQVRVRLGRG